ncbi:Uncharacterised protein [Mycobacteroides abscessus subsp. abscessus]|nr:Uncharacterised protein [Mycobacteroides abscessus subsp. abscessus]
MSTPGSERSSLSLYKKEQHMHISLYIYISSI